MNQAYEEYKKEHPEELKALNAIKKNSFRIELMRKSMRSEKLKKIEECRRRLNGE